MLHEQKRKNLNFIGVSGKIQNQKNTLFENKIDGNEIENDNAEEWLNTNEAAEYLRISPARLRNLTSNGRVPYYKFQRGNRYLKGELRSLLLANRRGGLYGN
ncbi:MAG: helix-turn-helix domain-containing protein [Pseudobdellovibrionaceae bacterium]